VCVCVCVCVCVRVCVYLRMSSSFISINSINFRYFYKSNNILVTVLVTTSHLISQEISRILYTLKAHGHFQNIPLLVPVVNNILDTRRGFIELPAMSFFCILFQYVNNINMKSTHHFTQIIILSVI